MTTNGGGWTVIDYNHSSVWQNYFESWRVFDGSRMAMPNVSVSGQYWVNWFLPAGTDTVFRISPGCTQVQSTSSRAQAYATTGNFYGCRWYNDNCNMSPGTQQCYECFDDHNIDGPRPGTCSHLVMRAEEIWNAIYEGYNHSCSGDWWNRRR